MRLARTRGKGYPRRTAIPPIGATKEYDMAEPFLPRSIFDYLSGKVLGQQDVLRLISVSLYKHIHDLKAGNVLFIGNSGTGKTTVMKAVNDFYDEHEELERFRVMIIINANTLAAENEGEDRTLRLFKKIEAKIRALHGSELDAATLGRYMENATVCIDEVDKISARISGKANVEGISIQYALLTLLEGEKYNYSTEILENGTAQRVDVPIDTSKMLFICGGAFEELFDQVYTLIVNRRDERRLKEVSEVDKAADGSVSVRTTVRFTLKDYLKLTDLFTYGMMPQFISRFSSVAIFENLGKEDLKRIMITADDSPLRYSRDYFKHMGITLQVTDKALDVIADEGMKNARIGARALREIYTGLIAPLEFDPFSSDKIRDTDKGKVLVVDQGLVEAYVKRLE